MHHHAPPTTVSASDTLILLLLQGFTEKDKLDIHVKRHMEDGPGGLGGGAPTSSLAALLREGVPKEPLPLTLAEKSLIEAKQLQQQHQQPLAVPASPEVKSDAVAPPLHGGLGGDGLPGASPSPLRVSSASPSTTTTSSPNPTVVSPFAGLPMGFASPFASLMRAPLPLTSVATSNATMAAAAVAQQAAAGLHGLMPPGLAPFFPPGMMLPGLTAAAAAGLPGLRAPMPAPTYDPMRHPLTRMPDAPEFRKRANASSLFGSNDDSEAAKKARMTNSMRMLKDEPVPEGYMRFRFNEDCGFTSCNYREHQGRVSMSL